MKILHTADWHLAKNIYGRSMLEDQADFINRCFLPLVREERPDLVLLAGDVFDRQVSPVAAIQLFDHFLVELHTLGVPLAVIAGNHDGAERMSVGAGLLRSSGVYIAGDPGGIFEPVRLAKGAVQAHVYLLPYCEPARLRELLGDPELRTFSQAYGALLDKLRAQLDPSAVNILAAHCFVAGSVASASESPIYVGGTGEVASPLFAGFDYVALGHLHAPQRAGETGWYAGSPLKYSFDEARQRKGITVLELDGKRLERSQRTFQPLHDLRVLQGRFDALLEQGRQAPSEDYLFAELEDDGPVYMPMDRLRAYYPNMLGLHSRWLSRAGQGEVSELKEQLLHHRASDGQVLREFFNQICGMEADQEDQDLFVQMMKACEEEEA